MDAAYWQANAATITPFFAYYDKVVPTLVSLFHVSVPLPMMVEVPTPTPDGAACACGPIFGVKQAIRISGASFGTGFTNAQLGLTAPGYWGYLLTLHETINAFTF